MHNGAKKRSAARPAALYVKYERPDSFGTQSVRLSPCEREREDDGSEYPRSPETLAGIYTDHSSLGWSVYRYNRSEDRGAPVALSLSATYADYRKVFSVTLDRAEQMAKGLRTVAKRLRAQSDKYGFTADFAEAVLRIAAVFGAQSIAIDMVLFREVLARGGRQVPEYLASDRWAWLDVATARGFLDELRDVDLPRAASSEPVSS